MGDRIKSLGEVINNEKETRELWIARYEDEQKNHTNTNSSLLQARSELSDWLRTYPGHALEEQVRIDPADALQLLADSDLAIARFYRKVESPDGFEFHARRALETARDAGDPGQVEEAEALLAEAIEAAP